MSLTTVRTDLVSILNGNVAGLAGRVYGQEMPAVQHGPECHIRLDTIEDMMYTVGGKRRMVYVFIIRFYVQFSDNAQAEADLCALIDATYIALDTHKRAGWGTSSTVVESNPLPGARAGYASSNGVMYRSVDIPLRVVDEEVVTYA